MILSFFFFRQKTAYEMRISDWSSDVFSSDLRGKGIVRLRWRLRRVVGGIVVYAGDHGDSPSGYGSDSDIEAAARGSRTLGPGGGLHGGIACKPVIGIIGLAAATLPVAALAPPAILPGSAGTGLARVAPGSVPPARRGLHPGLPQRPLAGVCAPSTALKRLPVVGRHHPRNEAEK